MKIFFTSFLFLSITAFGYCQTPSFIYTPTCFGDQTTLVGSSALADTAISSWQWDLDGNGTFDAIGKTIIHLFTTASTFSVKLKITPNYAPADSVLQSVVIDPLPSVNFRVDNLCALKLATYYNQSTIASGTITSYNWDFNNDGVVDNNSNDTVTYVCGPAQVYQTRLTCVSNKGCSAFAVKTTQVYPVPVAQFTANHTCAMDTSLFLNTTTNIPNPDYFYWSFGDGNQGSTTNNAAHIYAAPGSYNVSLIAVSVNGCRDTSAVSSITVTPRPTVLLTTSSLDGSNVFFEGTSITLTATGTNTYVWNTSETTSSIAVQQTGTYSVTGRDALGCTTDASIYVKKEAIPESIATTSNILTPNGDGINDYLIIQSKDAYQTCTIMIYNIWNVEVYSKDGYNNDWDGTTSDGKKLPDGAYYYIITCDDKAVANGNINILLK